MTPPTIDEAREILEHFAVPDIEGPLAQIGAGHINTTWKLTGAPGKPSFVLQRLNPAVFGNSQRTMENVVTTTSQLATSLADFDGPLPLSRTLSLVPAGRGWPYYIDETQVVWRCYPFIDNTVVYTEIDDLEVLKNVAAGFGLFVQLMSTLKQSRIHETLPGFHDTPARLEALRAAVSTDSHQRVDECRDEIRFAESQAALSSVLTEPLASEELPTRVIHGDTKVSNILLDAETGRPACVVDLDTVMLGTLLYDFGDLVRSSVAVGGEELPADKVVAQPDRYAALAEGYLSGAGDLVTDQERALMGVSGQVLAYECGMRFLADYLQGDVYFRSDAPGENLVRARNQFALVRSLQSNVMTPA